RAILATLEIPPFLWRLLNPGPPFFRLILDANRRRGTEIPRCRFAPSCSRDIRAPTGQTNAESAAREPLQITSESATERIGITVLAATSRMNRAAPLRSPE